MLSSFILTRYLRFLLTVALFVWTPPVLSIVGFYVADNPKYVKTTFTLRTGFEPVREDPIGFQVQRLNHSAIAAALTTQTSLYITEHWEQKVAAYT